jgi:AcrR family transcriptional regulator
MPKIVDRQEYRQTLLDQCFDLFAKKGYASVTMQQIAAELGVSTGTLYHYFPNKKSLFEQLIEEITQRDIFMAIAELDDKRSILEKMEGLGQFIAKHEDYFIKQIYLYVDFSQFHCSDEILDNSCLLKADQSCQKALSELLEITDRSIIQLLMSFINGLLFDRLSGSLTGDASVITEQIVLMAKMLDVYMNSITESTGGEK